MRPRSRSNPIPSKARRRSARRRFPVMMQGQPPIRRQPFPAQAPNGQAHPPAHVARRRSRTRRLNTSNALLLGLGGMVVLMVVCLLVAAAGFGLIYSSGRALPGVHAAGVDLGNMTEAEAAQALAGTWNSTGLLLRDGDRVWAVTPAELGIRIDDAATAQAAVDFGRGEGGLFGALQAIASDVDIDPVLAVDLNLLSAYLENARPQFDQPAVNAGVRLVSGQVVASPAREGRQLNTVATVDRMRVDAARELADGALDLTMSLTYPAITDAAPLVAQAAALLSSPFTVNAYDPVRDEWQRWSAPPDLWATWISAAAAPAGSNGLALSFDTAGPTAFLQSSSSFGDERRIEVDKAVVAMQDAITRGQTNVTVRIWHGPTTYTVQSGQTLAAIAEEIGIPYPYIQAENPGINTDALSVGQSLAIPSKDILIPLDPIPSKRIVLSRSQQHLWAYENGQVVFDWVISTGLPSSPTALGVFQIQSHELNAYAEQWNLYMPHFMGFYHPGPNMDLWNGFHGYPTRGGGYLLWSDDLGTPVTYGCVLLSLENAEALYNWAAEGVVVEVKA